MIRGHHGWPLPVRRHTTGHVSWHALGWSTILPCEQTHSSQIHVCCRPSQENSTQRGNRARCHTVHGVPHAWLLGWQALLRGDHATHGRDGRAGHGRLPRTGHFTLVPGQLSTDFLLTNARPMISGHKLHAAKFQIICIYFDNTLASSKTGQ